MNTVTLIDQDEYQKIENKVGTEMETLGLIAAETKAIRVRDIFVPFDNDFRNYEKVGIKIRDFDNPRKLIGFGGIVRYLHETVPHVIAATDADIRRNIPVVLPWLMTIEEFHVENSYARPVAPSDQETSLLIAEVLATRNVDGWKPTKPPNNHWSNWESGFL